MQKKKDAKTIMILDQTLRQINKKVHEDLGKTICQNLVAMETSSHVIKQLWNQYVQI